MATARCDDCGKATPVPDDHPVDWWYCDDCREIIRREREECEHEHA